MSNKRTNRTLALISFLAISYAAILLVRDQPDPNTLPNLPETILPLESVQNQKADTPPIPTTGNHIGEVDPRPSHSPKYYPGNWNDAVILHERIERPSPDEPGIILRHRVIIDDGFNFPIRVTEAIEFDSNGSAQILYEVSAYAANQILLHSQSQIEQSEINIISEALDWEYSASESSQYVAVLQSDLALLDTVDNAVQAIFQSDSHIIAEPNYIYYTSKYPNDPRFLSNDQWGLHIDTDFDIDAPEGWGSRTSADNVIIAVIDTGIRLDHEDITDNLWINNADSTSDGRDNDKNGYIDDIHGYNAIDSSKPPSDDNGHGTQVAGIAGARGNNNKGISGVAWSTRLMAIKALNTDGRGAANSIVKAIDYAVDNGAKIINASWGSSDYSGSIESAIKRARDKQVIVVAAAGNDGSSRVSYPGSSDLENVLTVGSIDANGEMSSFSNYNSSSVDVFAPGRNIISTSFETIDSYSTESGTSMAAPFVSGILALTLSKFPNDTLKEHKQRILESSTQINRLKQLCVSGGIVKLRAALDMTDVPFPPKLLSKSDDLSIYEGNTASFSIEITSETSVTYTWFHNEEQLSESSNRLELDSVTASQMGTYTVEVNNGNSTLNIQFSLIVFPRMHDIEVKLDFEAQIFASHNDHWKIIQIDGIDAISNTEIKEGDVAFLEFRIPEPGLFRTIGKITPNPETPTLSRIIGDEGLRSIQNTNWKTYDLFRNSEQELRIDHQSSYSNKPTPANTLQLRYPKFFNTNEMPPIVREHFSPQHLAIGEFIYLRVSSQQSNLNYQWYKDETAIEGENTDTLSYPVKSIEDQGDYHVLVSNDYGSYRSSTTFIEVDTTPQPAKATISGNDVLRPLVGEPLVLKMDVFGQKPIRHQWYRDFHPIPGATDPILDLGLASAAHTGGYYLHVENDLNQSPYVSDRLLVVPEEQIFPPKFTDVSLPAIEIILPTGSRFEHRFDEPAGSFPFTYVWYKDGEPIEGEQQTNTLSLDSITFDEGGTYYLEATNSLGKGQSRRIHIKVTPKLSDAIELPYESLNYAEVEHQTAETYDSTDALEFNAWGPIAYLDIPKEDYDRVLGFYWKFESGETDQFTYEVGIHSEKPLPPSEGWQYSSIFVPRHDRVRFSLYSYPNPARAWLDQLAEIKKPFLLEDVGFTPPVLNKKVVLSASAFGTGLSYQWYKDEEMIQGATSDTYTIDAFNETDTGNYHLIIKNEWGEANTSRIKVEKNATDSFIDNYERLSFTDSSLVEIVKDPDSPENPILEIEPKENSSNWGFEIQIDGPATFSMRYEFGQTDPIIKLDGVEIETTSDHEHIENTQVFITSGSHTLSITGWQSPNTPTAKIYSLRLRNEPLAQLSLSGDYHHNHWSVPSLKIDGIEPLSIIWYKDGIERYRLTNLDKGLHYPYNRNTIATDRGNYTTKVTDANGNSNYSNEIFFDAHGYLEEVLDTEESYVVFYHYAGGTLHYDEDVFNRGNSSLRIDGPYDSIYTDPSFKFNSEGYSVSLKLKSEGFPDDNQITYENEGELFAIPVNEDWNEITIDYDEYGVFLHVPNGTSESKIWIDDYQIVQKAKFRIQPPDISTYIGAHVTIPAHISSVNEWSLDLTWYKDGVEIPGNGSNSLEIESLTLDDLGEYFVRATHPDGSIITSRTATLSLTPPELSEAIGYPGARITTIGPSPWFVDYTESIDGSSSIKSGYLEKGQTTQISIELDGNIAWGLYHYTDFDLNGYSRNNYRKWSFERATYVPHRNVSEIVLRLEEPDGVEKFNFSFRIDGVRTARMSNLQYENWIREKTGIEKVQLSEDSKDRIADPDDDSIPNWLEFVLGLNPIQKDEAPTWRLAIPSPGETFIELEYLAARSGEYSVMYEITTDFFTWSKFQPKIESSTETPQYDKIKVSIPLGNSPIQVRWTIHHLSEEGQNTFSTQKE